MIYSDYDPFGLCALFSWDWVLKMLMMIAVLLTLPVAANRSHLAMCRAEICVGRAFRVHRACRDQLFQVSRRTGRAPGRRRGGSQQILELLFASLATILVNGHETPCSAASLRCLRAEIL
jgi:hypothetical protein